MCSFLPICKETLQVALGGLSLLRIAAHVGTGQCSPWHVHCVVMVRTQLEVFDREVEFCTIPWSSLTAPRSIRTAVSFLFQDDPFSQEIEGFGTSCPRWMPGYQAFGSSNHGFCRKLKGLKHVWIPPQDPAPTPQPHHRHHPRPSPPPPTSWEPPRQSVRQQQKSFASEQPQVRCWNRSFQVPF